MATLNMTTKDLAQLKKHGLSSQIIKAQLKRFKQGFPWVCLVAPCVIGKGIFKLSPAEEKRAEAFFLEQAHRQSILKFVPASGAASRMFHFLEDPASEYDFLKEKFLKHLPDFAFYSELAHVLKKRGLNLVKLRQAKNLQPIVQALLEEEGLGYRKAPKGSVLFHYAGKQSRTAFEEQMRESLILKGKKKKVQIHFTLPESLRTQTQAQLKKTLKTLPHKKVLVTDSVQSSATDCLALEKKGTPARDNKGKLLLRPAGHGALLANLNQIKADLIYVKNIDNILPEKNRHEADRWKRILGGVFLEWQAQIFKAQKILKKKKVSPAQALELLKLAHNLGWNIPERGGARKNLEAFFNRPLRVCGMVPNTGEPGGGPFWTRDSKGILSPQIIESAEVHFKDKKQERIWKSSTHFNPVDFVCGVYNARGKKYDLFNHVDSERGLITQKTYQGRKIRGMEMPGLWNGGMADWISIFVEIPGVTFAPVKTVLDLLRKEHQA